MTSYLLFQKLKIIFRSFDFDYCIHVELDEFYKPNRILKIDVNTIKENLEKKYNRLSVSKITSLENM